MRALALGLSLFGLSACGLFPHRDEDAAVVSSTEPLAPAPAVAAEAPAPAPAEARQLSMNEIATAYVKLVLQVGQYDADYVDAFYGPAEWKAEAAAHPLKLPQIEEQAQELITQLADAPETDADENLVALRKSYLKNQLGSLTARARLLQGEKMPFDDEARALFDVEPPHYTEADFAPVLKVMDGLLPPGTGTLAQRYNQYVDQFAVPADKLDGVMRSAIGIAQYRSASHLALPPGERFDLRFVSGKPWSAYNWYQGNFTSRIEVNTDLPIPIGRVIELAAHEGYPGHHAYNALLEQTLVRGRGWPEYQVYALLSPQSFIAEGSADYGVSMVFPGNERLEFTRELFQLAGLDPKQAANYLQVVDAQKVLSAATIEGARRYIDGEIGPDSLIAWLQRYTLASPERAKQRLAFIDRYRSYIVNYSYGEELVRDFIQRESDKTQGSVRQWQAFATLLSTPRTPTELQAGAPLPLLPPQATTSVAISAPDSSFPEPAAAAVPAAAAAPAGKLATRLPEISTPAPSRPPAAKTSTRAAPAPKVSKWSPPVKVKPGKTLAKTPAKAPKAPAKGASKSPPPKPAQKAGPKPAAKPVPADDFKHFLAGKPTPAQFHKRYPSVSLILFGAAPKDHRTDKSRFFAQLDGSGRIVGGAFK